MKYSLRFLQKNPRSAMQIGILAVSLGMLYFSVFASMVDDWIHLPDFSHGFLIPIISLYFIYKNSERIDRLPVAPKNYGLIVILLGLFLLLVGNVASESFTMRFSLLFVLSGLVLFLLGWQHLKVFFFPIGLLFFMIPIPSILLTKITFPMQLFASNVATFSLQHLGVPVFREGNIIHLADTRLEVAEACSGIRSLISLLALGTIFAYVTKKHLWERAVVILFCFPIAIFVNALRVSATGVLANLYGASVAEGFFHGFSGFLLFIFAFGALACMSYLLSKLERRNKAP